MSILLEALRKSEKNQRSHEAPTIHEENQRDSAAESFKVGPLVLMLATALFVSGWFVWRQYQPPAGIDQPAVTLEEKVSGVETDPVGDEVDSAQARPQSAKAAKPPNTQRTPVESYSDATSNTSQPKPTGPGSSSGHQTKAQPAGTDLSAPAGNQLAKAARKQPIPDQTKGGGVRQTATDKDVSDKSSIATEEKYLSPATTPISYWELPDVIRADVQPIKFSVLVFANNPADRFVLINGQRLVEGDSLQDGLIVQEIRLDGVVFNYRLYEFLVER